MDTLSDQQRENIQKMSDERLRQGLSAAGMPAAAISALARPALIEAWAELVATGRERPTQALTVPMADTELEKRRLDFEERKWQEQLKLENDKWQEQMMLENQKLKIEQEHQNLEREKVQLEQQRLRLQVEAAENPAALAKNMAMLYAVFLVVCQMMQQICQLSSKMLNVCLRTCEFLVLFRRNC